MVSDHELLLSWRAGDRRAGSQLFARHFDSVRRFFQNKVDTSAEDLVQRTFMVCTEVRDRFREEASFRTFLFAIAHNLLKEHLRSKACFGRIVDFDRDSIVDLGASPTSVLAFRDREQLLVRALRQIPVDGQVLLELYYWEGLTGTELAEFLGMPEDTVRSRLRRAKALLRRTIHEVERPHPTPPLASVEQWARELRYQHLPIR